MTRSRLGTTLGAVVLLLVSVVGCTGEDEPDSPPSPAPSGDGEPSSEGGGDPVESSAPPTDPPEGTPYQMDGLSFVLPEPYRAFDETKLSVLANIGPDDPVALIEVTAFPSQGEMSLDETRQLHLDGNFYERRPKLLEPVTVGGVEMFHIAGKTNDITWTEAFGTDETGYTVDLTLEFRVTVPEAERQAVVDAVLDSVELTQ